MRTTLSWQTPKALVLVLGGLACAPLLAQEQARAELPWVAIIEPKAGQQITAGDIKTFRGTIGEFISASNKYQLVDRMHIERVIKEQKFQREGLVNPATMKKLGNMMGANIICVIDLLRERGAFNAEIMLIDVESGKIYNNVHAIAEKDNPMELKKLAETMSGRLLKIESPSQVYEREMQEKEQKRARAEQERLQQQKLEDERKDRAEREERERAERELAERNAPKESKLIGFLRGGKSPAPVPPRDGQAQASRDADAAREAEELRRREADAKAAKEAEARAAKEAAEAKALLETQQKALREAEARAAKEAEERRAKEEEVKALREQWERVLKEAEERGAREAEAKAAKEAEERTRKEAEAKAAREAKEAEERTQKETEARAAKEAKEAAERSAKEAEEVKARERMEAEARAAREAEARAAKEAEARAAKEAQERAVREAAENAAREAEETRAMELEAAELRRRLERAAKEAEEYAARELEAKRAAEAQELAVKETEDRAASDAEERARKEAEAKAASDAEERARKEAEAPAAPVSIGDLKATVNRLAPDFAFEKKGDAASCVYKPLAQWQVQQMQAVINGGAAFWPTLFVEIQKGELHATSMYVYGSKKHKLSHTKLTVEIDSRAMTALMVLSVQDSSILRFTTERGAIADPALLRFIAANPGKKVSVRIEGDGGGSKDYVLSEVAHTAIVRTLELHDAMDALEKAGVPPEQRYEQ
jgi:hypothetical protein